MKTVRLTRIAPLTPEAKSLLRLARNIFRRRGNHQAAAEVSTTLRHSYITSTQAALQGLLKSKSSTPEYRQRIEAALRIGTPAAYRTCGPFGANMERPTCPVLRLVSERVRPTSQPR